MAVSFTVPDKIITITDDMLKNSTREKMLAQLSQSYNNLVSQLEQLRNQKKQGKSEAEKAQVDQAFQEAQQKLGNVYNKQVDQITEYYKNSGTNGNNNNNNNNDQKEQTKQGNRIRELRNMPGFQNYVISANKSLNGVVDSAVYKKYYSDASVELYFNGHWLDDITAVNWHIEQNTQPLYGYNSFIYDDIAQGTRLIRGVFVVNFTEPDRLSKVIAQSKVESSPANNGATYEEYSKALYSATTISVNGTTTTLQTNNAHNSIWSNRFDIDIVFGEPDAIGQSVILPKHIVLWDCVLQGSSIGAATNDGVLQEQYFFIARDFKVIK